MPPPRRRASPPRVQQDGEYQAAVEAAGAAVEQGVKTIGEPTAMFVGRDVGFMRRVAEETGLQVVPCTGIYTYDYLPPFFKFRDETRWRRSSSTTSARGSRARTSRRRS